jgi:hypothetical protein
MKACVELGALADAAQRCRVRHIQGVVQLLHAAGTEDGRLSARPEARQRTDVRARASVYESERQRVSSRSKRGAAALRDRGWLCIHDSSASMGACGQPIAANLQSSLGLGPIVMSWEYAAHSSTA